MKEVIVAHLTCEICGDTWFRDMTEKQLADYMAEHPEMQTSAGSRIPTMERTLIWTA